jgi:signal peptidase II
MRNVTPIEPHIRRRDVGRQPRPVTERGVAIPVHQELPFVAPRVAPSVAPSVVPATLVRPPVDEMALAARFFPLVAAVAAAELASKAWAASALADRTVNVASSLALSLAYNPASAGGVSLGEHTRAINFTATGIIIGLLVMLAPTLARVDRRSWVALALIVGAGAGNLASLAGDPRGVVDFIAVGRWVLNVADVALIAGLALLSRTALMLLRAVRSGGAQVRVR